jgi:hypothetical protein
MIFQRPRFKKKTHANTIFERTGSAQYDLPKTSVKKTHHNMILERPG